MLNKKTDLTELEMLEAVSTFSDTINDPELEGWMIQEIRDGYFDPLTEKPDTARAEKKVAAYRAKIDTGRRLFNEGWRVNTTDRHVYGHACIDTGVPDKAVIFRKIDAGHLAQSPCYRYEYLYLYKGS